MIHGGPTPGRPLATLTAISLVAAVLSGGCSRDQTEVIELSGPTMGTSYSIQVSPVPDPQTQGELRQRVEQRLADVNRVMSTYIADSAISGFNASRSTDWQPVPASLVGLVELAADISRRTDGAYDVTVGPLVKLWGFGPGPRRDSAPPDAAIAAALKNTGFAKLQTRTEPPALRKLVADLEIDLSSIAKGWGVDEISRLLHDHGIHDHLVEIGGEVRASGRKADGRPWRIAIERPDTQGHAVQRVVPLVDRAMATSGDYRNFFRAGGRRYSHTIDPVSGQSVQHALTSVTVFAATCTEADAWATALMVLGDERGPAVAAAVGLEAFFIIQTANGPRELASPALARAAHWPAAH